MPRTEVIAKAGPGSDDSGLKRDRVGRPTLRPWTRGRIALLLAAAIGMPWLPALKTPPESLPMHRARGRSGVMIRGFAFGPDGQTIATADAFAFVTLRQAAGGWDIDRSLSVRGTVVAFSPDGRHLAVGGLEGDVVLCDPVRGGRERPLGIPVRDVSDLRFSPDGRTLAVSSYRSRDIILWDIEAGQQRMTLRERSSSVVVMAFAPDGRSLASAARDDQAILVWDLGTGQPRHRLVQPGVISLAFSPDGRLLAAADGREKSVRMWDARTGGRVPSIAAHALPVRSVAFSPDGRLLATGAGDGIASVWSVATGGELLHLASRADLVHHVSFSPDGRTLAATGNEDDVRFWELDGLITKKPES